MEILQHFSLKNYNTFGIEAFAKQFVSVHSSIELAMILKQFSNEKKFVLGGGSNMLLTQDIDALVIHLDLKGKKIVEEDADFVWVKGQAGENWHEFVLWTIENNFGGLENMSLIPGNVGTTPIQNIGAYGVEVGEYIQSIEAYDCHSKTLVNLPASDCAFTYRNSIFKASPNRYIITRVHFYLPAAWSPRLRYADLAAAFANRHTPTAEEVMVAVCKIRNRKLPDPKLIGNAGSFFQNPIVEQAQYLALLEQFPELVSYPEGDEGSGKRKLAAGWMIDHCGFKGLRAGAVGVYQHQALVIVNHGGGNADSVLALAKTIQDKVQYTFGVALSIEPIRY